jgi:hypothetical protein
MELERKGSEQKWGLKKDILQEIEEQQLRRYGHLMRMRDGRIATQVTEWNSQRQRGCGRPVSTWKDGIRDNMQSRKLKDQECFDREPWREKL